MNVSSAPRAPATAPAEKVTAAQAAALKAKRARLQPPKAGSPTATHAKPAPGTPVGAATTSAAANAAKPGIDTHA